MVEHYFTKGRGQITNVVFRDMVKIILTELPDEDPHTWYNPPINNRAGSGLLYTRYRYLLQHDKRFRQDKQKPGTSRSVHFETLADTWELMTEVERDACSCKLF